MTQKQLRNLFKIHCNTNNIAYDMTTLSSGDFANYYAQVAFNCFCKGFELGKGSVVK